MMMGGDEFELMVKMMKVEGNGIEHKKQLGRQQKSAWPEMMSM